MKKINTKLIKLIKYYTLINHNLIFDKNAINRYDKTLNGTNSDKISGLGTLKKSIFNLKNCNLKKKAKNLVFSDGNPSSKVMIVGEGPGANEDIEGLPFVGRAGQLLDKMLQAINLDRTKVYITNVVNYRPPENRKPTEEEILRYLPFLVKHIEIIKPKILVLLGSTALNSILGSEKVISKARGIWVTKQIGSWKTNVIASFHPAYLMRQPDQKKHSWVDLKMIKKKLEDLNIKIDN